MNNNSNSNYIRIEIPKSGTDFIEDMHYSQKLKIFKIQFLEKYDRQKIHSFFSSSNMQKSLKDLQKKIKQGVPGIAQEDLTLIDEIILENIRIFDIEHADIQSNSEKEIAEERPEMSFEDWRKKLQEKYEILRKTTFKNFPDVWQAIEYTLSVKNILHIKGNTLPFAGIILGPPSSSKTLSLEMLRKLGMTFYTDSFTAKSFVSHITTVNQEMLEKIDMLPKIRNKLFLTPELAPLFSAKDEDLLNVLGIVTRILDGHGYESDSGALGHRGYPEDIMFTWVGAAVEIPYKVYKHLGTLGPKLYFYRMSIKKKKESELLNDLRFVNFNSSKKEIEDALIDYLKWFDYCPIGNIDSKVLKIPAEHECHEEQALKWIIRLGRLLSHLRGAVQTWETRGTQGSDYSYATPIIENPDRAITCLRNLAIGHAFISGRNYITMEDIPILIKTVLSTAPVDRFKAFDQLLERGGELKTSTLLREMDFSRPTALRTMTELKVLGLVNLKKENEEIPNSIQSIKLKKEFDWFLSDEFRRLRDGFIPEKFETKECKEKSPPPALKKYDDGENFDFDYLKKLVREEFKQLESKESAYEEGYPLVTHMDLRDALLQNPLLVSMRVTEKVVDKVIDMMKKEGIICVTREGRYYRSNKDDENNPSAAAAAA